MKLDFIILISLSGLVYGYSATPSRSYIVSLPSSEEETEPQLKTNDEHTRDLPCSLFTVNLKDPISDLVLKIIHEIQTHMHDGIPSMGIPPLDPLKIDHYAYNVRESGIKVYGDLRNITVANLSTFNVTNINTHLWKRSVTVSIEIPDLVITGLYTLKGKALSFFPITGNGPFLLKPIDNKGRVDATVTYQNGHFVLDSFDYKVTVNDLYAKFEGIYGSGLVSDILNKILNKFGITLFDRLEPLVHEDIRKQLEEDINRILRDLKMGDIMDSIENLRDRCFHF